jgi:hypothetical protein
MATAGCFAPQLGPNWGRGACLTPNFYNLYQFFKPLVPQWKKIDLGQITANPPHPCPNQRAM